MERIECEYNKKAKVAMKDGKFSLQLFYFEAGRGKDIFSLVENLFFPRPGSFLAEGQ